LLGVGVIDLRAPQPPAPMRQGYILKKTLQVREAWTIGVNDIDGSGVLPEDDVPIPPEHESDAPVRELLRRQREQSSRLAWPSLANKAARGTKQRRRSNGKSERRKKGKRQRRK
jgi:hypothetical protein